MPGSQLCANPAAGISHLPEATPVEAETAARSVLPFLLMLPSRCPLLSGDSALVPEQQAGGRDRMREDGRRGPWPKPPMKRNKARLLIASPSPSLLSAFFLFDPLGHSSCCLTSIPLSPLCGSDRAPFSFYRTGFPCLPPNGKLPGLAGQWGEPEERTRGPMQPPACSGSCSPLSFGTSLGGGQVAALPGETCFRRAQQVILVPASLRDDLIFREAQPPSPRLPRNPHCLAKAKGREGPGGISHKVRPDQDTNSQEATESRCHGRGSHGCLPEE